MDNDWKLYATIPLDVLRWMWAFMVSRSCGKDYTRNQLQVPLLKLDFHRIIAPRINTSEATDSALVELIACVDETPASRCLHWTTLVEDMLIQGDADALAMMENFVSVCNEVLALVLPKIK